MYRLILYYLAGLLGVAFVLCLFKLLPYDPFALLFSTLFIVAICWVANTVTARILRAPTNTESIYITALILALVINPLKSLHDSQFLILAAWASILAMESKYILAISRKHVFNPAALGVAVTAAAMGLSASWWVGTRSMAPFVLFGGLLIVRKLRRSDLTISFLAVALLTILGFGLAKGSGIAITLQKAILDTPILFMTFVMITEPLTTPPTRLLRIAYGIIAGFVFAPSVHIGPVYSTPELTVLVGNIFSYLVSPKQKFMLVLKEKLLVAADTYDFVFQPVHAFKFLPGQYLEWTLSHRRNDRRGNRRYFTIASSPTEQNIRIGVKFYPQSSSFKKGLLAMKEGDTVVASQLSGEFVMPKDVQKKLVFIAGGIGVTPFRSMIKDLLDRNEKRTITLFYSNKLVSDIAYADIFNDASAKLGIKTVYTLADTSVIPPGWKGRTGFVDEHMIKEEVPDFKDRFFYLSGPHGMVNAFDQMLRKMGVPNSHIKKDFFPGFA